MAVAGVILRSGQGLVVKTWSGVEAFDAAVARKYAGGPFLLFCDLRLNGLMLCRVFAEAFGELPRTHIFGMDIYYVAQGKCIIKNTKLFGLDDSRDFGGFADDVGAVANIS